MGRDYTYVDDIVAGVLAALEHVPHSGDGAAFDVFNLGNSHPERLFQLVDLLEQITGRKDHREYQPRQPGDVPLTWVDISRAKRPLGYQPSTRLEEGSARFVGWYRSPPSAFPDLEIGSRYPAARSSR
jgi:UDP-glucuronate 4-epimerase